MAIVNVWLHFEVIDEVSDEAADAEMPHKLLTLTANDASQLGPLENFLRYDQGFGEEAIGESLDAVAAVIEDLLAVPEPGPVVSLPE